MLYREKVDESVLDQFAKAREAAFYLSKARMSMIAAHSAKRTRAPDRLVETE